MPKAYGKADTFGAVISVDRAKQRDVFSDSTTSSSSNSSMEAHNLRTRPKPRGGGSSKRVLADVSNVQVTAPVTRPKRRGRPAKAVVVPENIPNFDSFDDYELIVRPVTPIKTHVSVSTPSSDDIWDNFPTQDILANMSCNCLRAEDLPVSSSPQPAHTRATAQSNLVKAATNLESNTEIHKSLCVVLERLEPDSLGASGHSPSCDISRRHNPSHNNHQCSNESNLSVSMHARRAKRLRHLLNDSVNHLNTSTPEQIHKKMARMRTPPSQLHISHIPALQMDSDEEEEADELVASMGHMSLHDSLKELHSPPLSGHIDESHILDEDARADILTTTTASLSMLSVSEASTDSAHSSRMQQSASLFSASYRAGSTLNSILEEEEEGELLSELVSDVAEQAGSTSSSAAYLTAEDHSTSYSGHTPPSKGHRLSDEMTNALLLSLQKLQTPSLSELSHKRRRHQILRLCMQTQFFDWLTYRPVDELEQFVKIGEGVYGEVFRFEVHNEVTIVKVVPMEGECTVNDEPQKRFHEMTKEIQVTRELSDIGYNFIHTKRVVCVQGVYPDILLDKWDDYKNTENDRPDYFTPEQFYTVFEFSDGGEALESYQFGSAAEGLSCLLQVGWSLAIAEDACQFEHRDLHWGNVLLAQEPSPTITYTFKSQFQHSYTVKTAGVKVHIIDFTLSRLQKDEEVVYFDLSEDETLFQGVGDYQFDVYRQMKDVTRNDWRHFYSVTNILWIRYLVDKLLKAKTFTLRRRQSPTPTQLKKSLLSFYERCSHYTSAVQMVMTDELFKQNSAEEECS